jgi:hypothetical protein
MHRSVVGDIKKISMKPEAHSFRGGRMSLNALGNPFNQIEKIL